MKLNTKVRYGLRAMTDIAENQSDGGVLQKDIAERQDIPLSYLDSIISGLRRRGLIMNAAGKRSGYKLTKSADEITVYDVYRSFEPELTLINCLCDKMECQRSGCCPARDYWFELNKHLKGLLSNSTLDQIMKGEFKLQAYSGI